ncbi:MAG: glycosyltransferase family 39 protein [bacterium]
MLDKIWQLLKKEKTLLIIIVIMAVLIRLIALCFVRGGTDSDGYNSIALNIATKGEFSYNYPQDEPHIVSGKTGLNNPTSFRAPLYPFFIAIFYFLFGYNYLIPVIFQIFLSGYLVFLTFQIGEMVFNKKVGLLSSFLLAFYPTQAAFSFHINRETLLTLFTLLTVYFLLRFLKDGKRLHLVSSIVALGLGILTKPVLLLFVPLTVFWMVLYSKSSKRAFKNIIITILLITITILPWTLRNYRLWSDRFVLISTIGGFTFCFSDVFFDIPELGKSQGKSNIEKNYAVLALSSEKNIYTEEYFINEYKRIIASLDEVEIDKLFYKNKLMLIKKHPLNFIHHLGYGFWQFFSISLYSWKHNIVYGPMLAFFILGLITVFTKWRLYQEQVMIILFIFAVYILSSMVYFSTQRNRIPIEPFMIIFASHGIGWVVKKIENRCHKR